MTLLIFAEPNFRRTPSLPRQQGRMPMIVVETSRLHSLTGLPRSLGLLLQSVYRLFQANAGSGVDRVTIKETLHRMLGSSRLSHELSQSKTSGSGDGTGISGTSFNSLTRVIFDRS